MRLARGPALRNPYTFFVGCARSGTTLVQRIGDAHPQLAVLFEQRWLPRFFKRRIGLTPDGYVTPVLAERLMENRKFRELNLPTSEVIGVIEAEPPKHYAQAVAELFDLYGKNRGKPYVGEKNPGYVRRLGPLNRLWPHAKIVHVIRDGRDVALSTCDFKSARAHLGRFPTWDEDWVTTAAIYWEWSVRLGREAGARLGSDLYWEVRYEALVADPERESRNLCEFLGLAYAPEMLRFYEAERQRIAGLKKRRSRAGLPVTSGLRSWRNQMSPADVRRFEVAAGPLLANLGYDRSVERSSADAVAHAARIRGAFISRRQSLVPVAWQHDPDG